MPIAKSDIAQHLLAGLRTIFREAYDSVDDLTWTMIATEIASTMDTETYAWLGALPSMREFLGERVLKALSEMDYTLKNKTWESTIGVERSALEDDQYGAIKIRVQDLAQEARRHQESLVYTVLAAGFTSVCYDGQYFFDTDHSEGDSGTQSNKGTAALDTTSLKAAIIAMSKFKNDQGNPMGIIPDTLVVPPDLKFTAQELLKSEYKVDTSTGPVRNVLAGSLGLIVSPYLTDTNNWYLLCTKRPVKPIIFQNRVPVEFQSMEANTDTGFMKDLYAYGVRARYNVGYGLWQLAYGALVS